MRWLLLSAALLLAPAWAEEVVSPAPSVREKLRVRILETLPPSSPGTQEDKPEQDGGVLVLEPIVVTESRGARELAKALVEEKQRQEAERFSVLRGGKIYSSERLDVGIWWAPGGWQLVKIKW